MYGLLVDAARYVIEIEWGTEVLRQILEQMRMPIESISTHDRYSEKIVPHMLDAAVEITGLSADEVYRAAGKHFVHYTKQHGYGEFLRISGRRFSDFLKGMDNLHEYMRFSYPKIRPPSFYCEKERADGLTLHYRTRRRGYISYVIGQLHEIAESMYGVQNLSIKITKKEERGSFLFVVMRLEFDNTGVDLDKNLRNRSLSLNEFLPVDTHSFLQMFPYFMSFNRKMEITHLGRAIAKIMPELEGRSIGEEFDLHRPCIKFNWDGCLRHLNNIFYMESTYAVEKKVTHAAITFKVNDLIEDKVEVPENADFHSDVDEDIAIDDGKRESPRSIRYLELRGPVVYLKQSETMVYLPTVVIDEMDTLFDLGLFLDDYSVADCNREMILASVQKSDDLKDLLKGEKEKSRQLTNLVKEVKEAKLKSRELLSQMMPRDVANQLLTSGDAAVIVQTFDESSVAFAKVCEFNALTSDLPAMDVVNLLNRVYSTLDHIIIKHNVYKVETIGECYMISCGVPIITEHHAEYIGDVALEMIKCIKELATNDILKKGKHVQIKIGKHF